MPEQRANGAAYPDVMTWARRGDTPAFVPAPGIRVQPLIGQALMTCWISMDPGAIVVEHSHPNEQLGVVIAGSVTITVGDETREMLTGDAYAVPPDLVHSGVAGAEGVTLVETFVPIRGGYADAWRAVTGA